MVYSSFLYLLISIYFFNLHVYNALVVKMYFSTSLCIVMLQSLIITSKCSEVQGDKLELVLDASSSNSELYGDFSIVNASSTLEVQVSSTVSNISFIVFQTHSHLYNVTLYQNIISANTSINGTNLGLYSPINPSKPIFFIYNPNKINLRIYISVHGYGVQDPIPGGCNLEFPIDISPFLNVHYNPNYIVVDEAPAQIPGDTSCYSDSELSYAFYRLYLPVRDLSAETYFEGIRKMITEDKISENGALVPTAKVYGNHTFWSKRTLLGNYPGTGSVYVVIVKNNLNNRTSTYVPSHSYGCSLLDVNDSCALLDDTLSQILCATLLFTGIFLCYVGHRFFKTEMFLMGMAFGFIITYLMTAAVTTMDVPTIVGASLLSGMFIGAIWWIYWWYYSIPLWSVMVPSLNVSFLLISVVYFIFIGTYIIFVRNIIYWSFFITSLIVITLGLLTVTYSANLFCCSVLGSFAIIYPIDFYLGNNLKYIIINIVRRVSVPKFDTVILSPPYQWGEALLTIAWIGLALTGFLFQHYLNRGKPPFPPPPRSTRAIPRDLGAYGTFTPVYWYRRLTHQNISHGTADVNDRSPLLA